MKVAVAMSGGVDSSVAALLLKEQGHEVIGLTMQLLEGKEERSDGPPVCCGLSGIADAQKVAHHIGIRHYVVNLRDIFRRYVIDNFISEYSRGRTPNPCIRCNNYIKFEALLNRSQEIGAPYLASGHYARLVRDGVAGKIFLKRGSDHNKDQSYVLYGLPEANLQYLLMPLGELTKSEVREIAKKERLPVADKRESQEICFISGRYSAFLEKEAPYINKPGSIVNSSGEVLGRHQGLAFFTIGQREGLGISSSTPLYVIGLNSRQNEVMVGRQEEAYSKEFVVQEVNILSGEVIPRETEVLAQIRYRHQPSLATLIPLNSHGLSYRVTFKEPQWGITPGQAAVFYQGDTVLAGGIIA